MVNNKVTFSKLQLTYLDKMFPEVILSSTPLETVYVRMGQRALIEQLKRENNFVSDLRLKN